MSSLSEGEIMRPMGRKLISMNGVYECELQRDGNLVIRSRRGMLDSFISPSTSQGHEFDSESQWMDQVIWSSNSRGRGADCAILDSDGNFVLYQQATGNVVWSSHTQGSYADRLILQNDGNLALTRSLWSTGSDQIVRYTFL